ncbi:MAG: DUF1822 family protein [Leptolyngbyaceae cyanobacterium]
MVGVNELMRGMSGQGDAMILPITHQGREFAEQFASGHLISKLTSQRAEQIRLNTLAVWAVHDYLNLLDIPSSLDQSDSWNPMMQLAGNIADLEVEGLGKVECRPIRADEEYCLIPPETWELRVGYVIVEISVDQKQAKLLGFRSSVQTEVVSVQDLQPLDALIDHLHGLRRTTQVTSGTTPFLQTSRQTQPLPPVQLGQWLQGVFEAGWQQVDQILTPDYLTTAYSFRTASSPSPLESSTLDRSIPEQQEMEKESERVERAKWIDLDIQLEHQNVALVVQIQLETEQKIAVTIQLYPGQGQVVLPLGIELQVLDESGAIFSQTQARETDNLVQLKFSGDRHESFQIAVILGTIRVVESFVL